MARSRAIMTDREREIVAGANGDVKDEYKYQVKSKIRNKAGELLDDLDILAEHSPDIYAEIIDGVCAHAGIDTTRSGDRDTSSGEEQPAAEYRDPVVGYVVEEREGSDGRPYINAVPMTQKAEKPMFGLEPSTPHPLAEDSEIAGVLPAPAGVEIVEQYGEGADFPSGRHFRFNGRRLDKPANVGVGVSVE